jgi:hypothetical protein
MILGQIYAGTREVSGMLQEMLGKDRTVRLFFSDLPISDELTKAENDGYAYALIVDPYLPEHFDIKPLPDVILHIHARDTIRHGRYARLRPEQDPDSVPMPLEFLEKDEGPAKLIHDFILKRSHLRAENNGSIDELRMWIEQHLKQIAHQSPIRHPTAA